jgi:hypothetical protein
MPIPLGLKAPKPHRGVTLVIGLTSRNGAGFERYRPATESLGRSEVTTERLFLTRVLGMNVFA